MKRLRAQAPSPSAPPSPQTPVDLRPEATLYVVGDVHGCIGLMEQILGAIDTDIETEQVTYPILVFVGDYVDRGEHSAQVLHRLHELNQDMPENVICLIGNHEKMLLDFLDRPVARGPRWLRNGGLQTLASYGVRGVAETADPDTLSDLAARLRHALPEGLEAWLRALPMQWQNGNILCVHAAADPEVPAEAQNEKVLLWGKRSFLHEDRHDGLCVLHGHTVVAEPERHPTRIAVDTGAYFSGQLTAAVLRPTGALKFLRT